MFAIPSWMLLPIGWVNWCFSQHSDMGWCITLWLVSNCRLIVPARIPTKGGQACPPLAENLYQKFMVVLTGLVSNFWVEDLKVILVWFLSTRHNILLNGWTGNIWILNSNVSCCQLLQTRVRFTLIIQHLIYQQVSGSSWYILKHILPFFHFLFNYSISNSISITTFAT